MVSVDGGQVDDAAHGFLQRVKVCRRKWQNVRVQWVIDVEKLHAALEGIVAPAETWTVEDTQTALNRHGAQPQLVVDGICGRNTRAAIVAFQRAHGLVPDGVVGPMTRAVLQA
jgi:murein L,D-transpeptidase YcbB/YkuD